MPIDAEIPASALAVYAHPDDPEISAGGTLASWAEAGADVSVLITTRGDKGTQDPDADLAKLARLRVEETAKAAALLGFAGHYHLGYHDGELPDDQELRAAITRYVRALRPQVVLCPDPTAVFFGDRYFNHHDHRVTGWATLDAVAHAAGNPHICRPPHRGSRRASPPGRVPLGDAGAELLGRHQQHARAQDRRALLPRQSAHGDRRVVPPVPARPRRGGGARSGRRLRRGFPTPELRRLTVLASTTCLYGT